MARDLEVAGATFELQLRSGMVHATPGDLHSVDAWISTSPDDADRVTYREVLARESLDGGARYLVAGHHLAIATGDLLDQRDSWGLACAFVTVSVSAVVSDSTVTVEPQDCPDGTAERVPFAMPDPETDSSGTG